MKYSQTIVTRVIDSFLLLIWRDRVTRCLLLLLTVFTIVTHSFLDLFLLLGLLIGLVLISKSTTSVELKELNGTTEIM